MLGRDPFVLPVLLSFDLLRVLLDEILLVLSIDSLKRVLVVCECLVLEPRLLWDRLARGRDIVVLPILLGLPLEYASEHDNEC